MPLDTTTLSLSHAMQKLQVLGLDEWKLRKILASGEIDAYCAMMVTRAIGRRRIEFSKLAAGMSSLRFEEDSCGMACDLPLATLLMLPFGWSSLRDEPFYLANRIDEDSLILHVPSSDSATFCIQNQMIEPEFWEIAFMIQDTSSALTYGYETTERRQAIGVGLELSAFNRILASLGSQDIAVGRPTRFCADKAINSFIGEWLIDHKHFKRQKQYEFIRDYYKSKGLPISGDPEFGCEKRLVAKLLASKKKVKIG